MAARIFVDTSGWYALIDRRDSLHERASTEVRRRLRSGTRLVTTDYVVDESCTLCKVRAGGAAPIRLLDLLDQTEAVDREWVTPERFQRSAAFFRTHRDQGYSFTDCTSFVLMRELRLPAALTSDGHFTTAGFEALLRE
jgi:uncharacterized protein